MTPWFIEEPTSPDDVAGHRKIRAGVAPVQVATGEMCQNRIMFRQFIMEGAIDAVQIDSCRMGGLNEVLAVMLMAAKSGPKVCPHAGGVGLCEYVRQMSMIDDLCSAGTREGRVIEYVDHLHAHFLDPCRIENAAHMPPAMPGSSIEMKPQSLERMSLSGCLMHLHLQGRVVVVTGGGSGIGAGCGLAGVGMGGPIPARRCARQRYRRGRGDGAALSPLAGYAARSRGQVDGDHQKLPAGPAHDHRTRDRRQLHLSAVGSRQSDHWAMAVSRMAAICIWTAHWAGRAGAGVCRAARRAMAGPRGRSICGFARRVLIC